MERIKIIAIVGPTASGKSELGVLLSKKFGGEVISVDSRQIYRGLNIGTGKITRKEMDGIPHHLLDVVSPRHVYTAADFRKDAEQSIRYIVQKEKVPIMVGGTGFYFDALLGTISLPEVPPNQKLRKWLEKKSTAGLVALLGSLDKRRARDIDTKNRRRLIRAIEIAHSFGTIPKLHENSRTQKYDVLWIGVTHPPKKLRERIYKRLLMHLKQGMIAEARRLHAQGLSYTRMREFGLEYRYLADHLQGRLLRDELTLVLEAKIWQYAKRQLTWFKRNEEIHWFRPTELQKINRLVNAFLLS